MATVGGSNQPQFNGKLGRVVYYLLGGKMVARGIGERSGAPSLAELIGQLATKIVCAFIKPLKPFINIGYDLAAKKEKINQHNAAFFGSRTFWCHICRFIYKWKMEQNKMGVTTLYSGSLASYGGGGQVGAQYSFTESKIIKGWSIPFKK